MCIDNEPKVLDGMDALLGGWGCRVLKAPDVATAIAAITESQAAPNGLLVDYHLDRGNGLDAIAELRHRFGADLPAILITADRSPHVRDAARADGAMARAAGGGGGMKMVFLQAGRDPSPGGEG